MHPIAPHFDGLPQCGFLTLRVNVRSAGLTDLRSTNLKKNAEYFVVGCDNFAIMFEEITNYG
jgi:hypothetical protein